MKIHTSSLIIINEQNVFIQTLNFQYTKGKAPEENIHLPKPTLRIKYQLNKKKTQLLFFPSRKLILHYVQRRSPVSPFHNLKKKLQVNHATTLIDFPLIERKPVSLRTKNYEKYRTHLTTRRFNIDEKKLTHLSTKRCRCLRPYSNAFIVPKYLFSKDDFPIFHTPGVCKILTFRVGG